MYRTVSFSSTLGTTVSLGGVEPKVTKVRVDASRVSAMIMAHFSIKDDKVLPSSQTHTRTHREQSRQLLYSRFVPAFIKKGAVGCDDGGPVRCSPIFF